MTTADLINAGFELAAAVSQWANVVKLYRDRQVAGVYWPVTAFFAVWGAWNIYFYTALSAPLSAYASWCVMLANAAWVVLALRYRTRRPAELPPAPAGVRDTYYPHRCQCTLPYRASDGFCNGCGGEGDW